MIDELIDSGTAGRGGDLVCGSGTRSPAWPSTSRRPPTAGAALHTDVLRRAARDGISRRRPAGLSRRGAPATPTRLCTIAARAAAAGRRPRLAPRGPGAIRARAEVGGRRGRCDGRRPLRRRWPEELPLGDDWQTAADAYETRPRAVDAAGETASARRDAAALLAGPEESVPTARTGWPPRAGGADPGTARCGPELAAAYSTLAVVRMMRNERPTQSSSRGGPRPWPGGSAPSTSSPTRSTPRAVRCDLERRWIEPFRRALELALSHNLQTQAGARLQQPVLVLADAASVRRGRAVLRRGIAYCAEHDLATYTYCIRSTRIVALEEFGRWDEALVAEPPTARRGHDLTAEPDQAPARASVDPRPPR